MTVKVTMVLDGVQKLQRALLLTNEATRTRVKASIRRGTDLVVAGAKVRVPKASGELEASIRAEFSSDGMVGYAKAGYGRLLRRSRSQTTGGKDRFARTRAKLAKAKSSKAALGISELGVYAPVVERGDRRRNRKPQPFLIPAFSQARSGIVRDIDTALKGAVRETTG